MIPHEFHCIFAKFSWPSFKNFQHDPSVGYRPDGSNPCRHIPIFPEGKATRLINDEEMVRIFRHLKEAESSLKCNTLGRESCARACQSSLLSI